MRSGILYAIVALLFAGTLQTVAQQDTCQPRMYYNPAAPTVVFLAPMPTPWFGIRMSTEWVSTVDSAYFGFGINRPIPSTKRDTLEVRVLGNTLPSLTVLDLVDFLIVPNLSGQFADGYYIAEFFFDSPSAMINPPSDFWLSWRLKGPVTDQARIMVKKPAIEPLRSVIINPNGSTTLATNFMRTQLGLTATDSVDFVAEARLCYPFGTPVELTSLHAVWRNSMVSLNWETATETNNYGFEVLRQIPSDQGMVKLWERLAFVQGNGTSVQPHSYQFTDPAPETAADAEGVIRYKLRQLDYDGASEMSHIVEAHMITTEPGFLLYQSYPNPVSMRDGSAVFAFSLPNEQHARLEVCDPLGRVVLAPLDGVYGAGRHALEASLSALRPGTWFYRLRTDSGVLVRRMIVTD